MLRDLGLDYADRRFIEALYTQRNWTGRESNYRRTNEGAVRQMGMLDDLKCVETWKTLKEKALGRRAWHRYII